MSLDSINIGTSGLVGFSKELQTISNNVANLNTPGYKSSSAQFASLFDAGGSGKSQAQGGAGMATLASVIDFGQGQVSQTGNDLDAAIQGQGFFVLRNSQNETVYTRDGRFHFDAKGVLVNTNGARVQALDNQGKLKDITLEGRRTSAASATGSIKFTGSLSTADSTKVVSGINVFDAAGGSHTLSVEFKNNTSVTAGSWLVTVSDGGTTVGTGEVRFNAGLMDPSKSTVSIMYSPSGVASLPITLSLESSVTSAASGASTLATSNVDGWGVGTLTTAAFDASGRLSISYTNGQTNTDQTLALANFGSNSSLQQVDGTSFRNTNPQNVTLGVANGNATTITPKSVEGSNVDLSAQFSAMIITQRGYQAASEIISTANQMLDTLMHMKG